MKFTTLVLATFILFLALKPGFDALSRQAGVKHGCCISKCTPEADNDNTPGQNDNSKGKSCNPFQVCGSCVFVCLNLSFDYLIKTASFPEEQFDYQSGFTSQFASDFWHPPKIV